MGNFPSNPLPPFSPQIGEKCHFTLNGGPKEKNFRALPFSLPSLLLN